MAGRGARGAGIVEAGYALGAADKRAGPWLSALGVVVLLELLVGVGRWLEHGGDG